MFIYTQSPFQRLHPWDGFAGSNAAKRPWVLSGRLDWNDKESEVVG